MKLLGIIHDDPVPKPEAVGVDEDAAAIANRIARNEAAVRRVAEMNEERRAKGPRVAPGVYYYDQEKEVVRDIFIAKMRYKDIQRELCIRPGATPEDTLKSALLQEKGAQTATDLQRQLRSSASMGNFSQSGATSGHNTRIKQEPTFSVQGKKLSDRISRAQNSKSKGNNEKSKSCYFCGNRFSANHKQSCPARNVTCKNCSKKGHFAKCCNSKKSFSS